MMNLEEIKARGEAAAVHEYDGITDLIYGRDVKALIAEVERLTAENAALENDKINAEMNLENLTAEVKVLNAGNATLKKALELAVPNGNDRECYLKQAQQTHDATEAEK